MLLGHLGCRGNLMSSKLHHVQLHRTIGGLIDYVGDLVHVLIFFTTYTY
jgi:hypothetical protein